MSKARDLADLISTGGVLADGAVSVSEISDLTATAAELNTLDGITASTADLNNVTNINTNVQTQLDLKAPLASPTFTGTVNVDGAAQIRGVTVEDSSGTTKGYVQGDADGLLIASDGTNNITFDVNAAERMRIDSSGNVGVGTSSPNANAKLTLSGAGMEVPTGYGVFNDSGGANATGINFTAAGTNILTFFTGNAERMRVDGGGNLDVGATNSSVFNGVGGTSRIVAKGSDTATNVANNSNASITIANDDGTANNLAGLHFARADTDDNPHYVGASIVAQFPNTQVTGQYPQGQLTFLTSTIQNAAPSEKLRISPEGAVGIGGANYGTSGQVLTSGGSGAAPTWADAATGGTAFSAF